MSASSREKRKRPDVPRKGNVDRNLGINSPSRVFADVPRKGNVDRNETIRTDMGREVEDVPRKGNVDRNIAQDVEQAMQAAGTFPARGTWIEMRRNRRDKQDGTRTFPARGTWIEIGKVKCQRESYTDVPRKGNVDRNTNTSVQNSAWTRRSPQGERG